MFEVWTPLGGCEDCQLGGVASDAIHALKSNANPKTGRPWWQDVLGAGLTVAGVALSRPPQQQVPQQAPPTGYNPPLLPPSPAAGDYDTDEQVRPPRPNKVELFNWTDDGLQVLGTTLSPVTLLFIAGGVYLLFKEPPRRGGGR